MGPGTNNVVRYVKEFCSWYYKYFIFAHIHTRTVEVYVPTLSWDPLSVVYSDPTSLED